MSIGLERLRFRAFVAHLYFLNLIVNLFGIYILIFFLLLAERFDEAFDQEHSTVDNANNEDDNDYDGQVQENATTLGLLIHKIVCDVDDQYNDRKCHVDTEPDGMALFLVEL